MKKFKNRISQYPNRRRIVRVGDSDIYEIMCGGNSVGYDAIEGEIIEPGTPLNEETLNNINDNGVQWKDKNGVEKDLDSELMQLNAAKQDKLLSGGNIKTINGQTVLGSGNIEVSGNKLLFSNYIYISVKETHWIYFNLICNTDLSGYNAIQLGKYLAQNFSTYIPITGHSTYALYPVPFMLQALGDDEANIWAWKPSNVDAEPSDFQFYWANGIVLKIATKQLN